MQDKEVVFVKERVNEFPEVFKQGVLISGVGLIICHKGTFKFVINNKEMDAYENETLFVPDEDVLQIISHSIDLEVSLLFYKVDNIRDIMSNSVSSMRFYSIFSANPNYVWETGEEIDVLHYISLLARLNFVKDDFFSNHERQLMLLALTHRLCSIYHRKIFKDYNKTNPKHDTFVRLIRLIDQQYTQHRGVEYYADKLCLSPKYLSSLTKSICGYTVQQLVFKSIIRKSISLLKNSSMTIQEISDYLNFPNASYFGTFFKKHIGVSPQNYRDSERQ